MNPYQRSQGDTRLYLSIPNKRWDLFLGGPPQKKARESYIDLVKKGLESKSLTFFSPFDRPTQQDGSWFEDNLDGIRHSQAMFAYIPSFPFPGVVWEVGAFYESHCLGYKGRLDNLVCVVENPDTLNGPSGKSVLSKQGHLFTKVEDAIHQLHLYFNDLRGTEAYFRAFDIAYGDRD